MAVVSPRRRSIQTRDAPKQNSKNATLTWLCSTDAYDSLCCQGYTRLSDCPEVLAAVNYIAELVSSMTIHLMQNSEKGDRRVRNGLARMVDITPNPPMTRKTWMYTIMRTMLLEGAGNAVVLPTYTRTDDYIERLKPLPPSKISFMNVSEDGYQVSYNGLMYSPDEVLHFAWGINPNTPFIGQGVRAALKDIVKNLKQASATKEGFMESKWKPSVIVKVDALAGEMASPDGRERILDDYITTERAGQPWVIPSEFIDIAEIKPLSLQDLAINDAVTLDKKTVASLFGVPPFVVGAGPYSKAEHNNFIDTSIRSFSMVVEQELTNKLLTSADMYYHLNPRSLYSYTLPELIAAGESMVDRVAMRRNEWRDWLGIEPDDDMEELLALENYIPAKDAANQKKLIQKEVTAQTGGDSDE